MRAKITIKGKDATGKVSVVCYADSETWTQILVYLAEKEKTGAAQFGLLRDEKGKFITPFAPQEADHE